MSFAAKLGTLTDELVELITSTSTKKDRDRFNIYRESSLRSLRHHNFLRTNQFEVENQLKGLDERFRVHHREGLADALKDRLESLATVRRKWHPDILHLLLELSDQPTHKTDLDDLALLREPELPPGPTLRWKDIAEEDGWDDDPDLWKSVSFSDSSDDGYRSDAADDSDDTSISALESPRRRRLEDLRVAAEDHPSLIDVRKGQAWRAPEVQRDSAGRPRKVVMSEFQIAREVLFMLHGLPTSLFHESGDPDLAYQMANLSWDTYKPLISWFAEAGRQLAVLRSFAEKQQTIPLLQVFHGSVATSLRALDGQLSSTQSRLVAPREDTIVSLISIQRELRPHLEPLNALSSVVHRTEETPNASAFRYLELLHHEVGHAQAASQMKTYEYLGRIFFDCFQVYLRPIRLWMQEGQLMPGDKIFFVSNSATDVPLHQIWQNKFKLRHSSEGKLHVLGFLQPSATRIFTTGKSIVVLKHMGKFESVSRNWDRSEPPLTFDAVCTTGLELAPFPELFRVAFNSWLQSKHSTTSVALKKVLFESCNLGANVDALEHLYLMSDGSVADNFAHNLFARIDSLRADWHDRYFLTGMAQEAFSSRLESHRVSAAVTRKGQRTRVSAARDSVRNVLPAISVNYRLSWPIQLVVSRDSLSRYQAAFTFLLQVRRAAYWLQNNQPRSLRDSLSSDDGCWAERALYYRARANMLWFCNCVQTYLSTLVLAPEMVRLRASLERDEGARDVDAMIEVHEAATKCIVEAACLGPKLDPIREGILDVLDLAGRLARVEAMRVAKEDGGRRGVSTSTSLGAPPSRPRLSLGSNDDEDDEEGGEEENDKDVDDDGDGSDTASNIARHEGHDKDKSYEESLREIMEQFERHLRFICGGLRGVARASGDEAASKWDLLAEMLETGTWDER